METPIIKKNNKYVFLDTCIIKHLGIEGLKQEILKNLKSLVENGFHLAISDFILLELFDGSTLKKEEDLISTLEEDIKIERASITEKIIITTAHLGCLYNEDECSARDIGDKIIGATALLNNALIYTTNGRDYPLPFYKILSKIRLDYIKKKRDVSIFSYVVQPDAESIVKKYNERTNSSDKEISVLHSRSYLSLDQSSRYDLP